MRKSFFLILLCFFLFFLFISCAIRVYNPFLNTKVFDSNDNVDPLYGQLNEIGSLTYGGVYDGPVSLAGLIGLSIPLDGNHVYATSLTLHKIFWFSRNDLSGSLSHRDSITSSSPYIKASFDNQHVYGGDTTTHSISWFSRNNLDGDLQFEGGSSDGDLFNGPNCIAVSPDGKNVYATAYFSMGTNISLQWSTRNQDPSGDLEYVNRFNGIIYAGINSAVVSPDNNNVYVTASNTNTIAWLTRDPDASGDLTYINKYTDPNIENPSNVIISPDGDHVYIQVSSTDSIAFFSRDADSSGDLTYEDAFDHVDITGLHSFAMSPDGKNIYVTGDTSKSIVWFIRDDRQASPSYGSLLYRGTYQGASFNGAENIEVSPDGKHVYVISYTDKTVIAWFTRDLTE